MMYKYVNGEMIQLTDYEEANNIQFYSLNQANPIYSPGLQFDGSNPPSYNMDVCKNIFTANLSVLVDQFTTDVNQQIEVAEEDGDSDLLATLFSKRKQIRSFLSIDPSSAQTIEDLLALTPVEPNR